MNALVRSCAWCAPCLVLAILACKPAATKPAAPKSPPPANVSKIAKEEDFATLKLTPEAERRLGITTASVESKKVGRSRSYGGELLLPLGRPEALAQKTALHSASSETPSLHGESIFSLLPSMTSAEIIRVAEMQVEADGQIAAAKVQLEGAKVAFERAEKLLAGQTGSLRAVDEARVQVRLAEANLQTMRARRDLLGGPIFETVKRDLLWVRTPVYVGDLPELNTTEAAAVGSLADRPGAPTRPAKPIPTPISAAGISPTVDLFYELENKDGSLRAGQKVSVEIPIKDAEETLVVPWPAVIHDIHGGAWVYEQLAPQTYIRQRVLVRRVAGSVAVLARGPRVGTPVVSEGAAELFGTELGFGK